jgi:hypothetical protein
MATLRNWTTVTRMFMQRDKAASKDAGLVVSTHRHWCFFINLNASDENYLVMICSS